MQTNNIEIPPAFVQGSPEWLALRKTKITATDANVIMGANPWKTKRQLYNEKISETHSNITNDRMQRGIDLEPIARELYCLRVGIEFVPKVVVRLWFMASLDGMSADNRVLEIKCPGEKDHALALEGKVPHHYYPQLQHQMMACGVLEMDYFSFDGFDGVIVPVKRDDKYIEKMIEEEKKFYDCMINRTPPEQSESEYIERDDQLWNELATRYKCLRDSIGQLEQEEEQVKKKLIFLSGESNCKGGGISLCQTTRKGNVDYAKIPELRGIDLDLYRKGSINIWRITT